MTDRELDQLIDAARELPVEQPEAARREAVRTSILAAAERTPPRRRSLGRAVRWVPVAAAAAVLLVLVLRDRPAAPAQARAATVQASEGAHFTHATTGAADEVVRLTSGRVTVDVEPLPAGQRFRVVTGDAEVEVHGTSFDVVVEKDELQRVYVHEGVVEVRFGELAPVVLHPGQAWDRLAALRTVRIEEEAAVRDLDATPTGPLAGTVGALDLPAPMALDTAEPTGRSAGTAVEPTAQAVGPPREPLGPRAAAAVPPAATNGNKSTPSPAETESSPGVGEEQTATSQDRPQERAFREGMAALRRGEDGAAAEAFWLALVAEPEAGLAEDARYWRGIALARAGRAGEAAQAMAGFLDRHPESARAGEVSAMLGWLLLEAGDREGAARRFRAATGDPDPRVAESAAAGLRAIEQ
jgi:TolA-binding protein